MKSPLFIAAESGNISKFRTSLLEGNDINDLDENGASPLMVACKFGHTELVKFIIKKGARLDLIDRNGMTAYKNALITNKSELINIFKNSFDNHQAESNPSINENFQKIFEDINRVCKVNCVS